MYTFTFVYVFMHLLFKDMFFIPSFFLFVLYDTSYLSQKTRRQYRHNGIKIRINQNFTIFSSDTCLLTVWASEEIPPQHLPADLLITFSEYATVFATKEGGSCPCKLWSINSADYHIISMTLYATSTYRTLNFCLSLKSLNFEKAEVNFLQFEEKLKK